ncbi:MAG: Na/Pi cotransporter family protein, partial [Christensenellaceae bacterium]|nr:Na/Pi cotransporter family protein [Christensenellaceae bacterium]
ALPMVIGMCIGACVPVLISAIGANVNGKRAAIIYLYFNIAGAVVLMIPFYLIHLFVGFDFMSTTATSIGIAIVNTVFKVAATIILMPFAKVLQKVAVLTIKDKSSDPDDIPEDNLLDERFLDYPPIALEQCGKTFSMMVSTAFKNLEHAISLLSDYSEEGFNKIQLREDRIDRYEDTIGSYLAQLNRKELSEKETIVSAKYLTCISNFERISDHAVNIAELAKELHDKKISFSPMALKEMQVCIDAVREIVGITKACVLTDDIGLAKKVEPLEEVIDILTKELKQRHIQRVQQDQCTLELGFIYNDCISNFERVADHCSNIAVAVLESEDIKLLAHDYIKMLNEDSSEYRAELELCINKYYNRLDNA